MFGGEENFAFFAQTNPNMSLDQIGAALKGRRGNVQIVKQGGDGMYKNRNQMAIGSFELTAAPGAATTPAAPQAQPQPAAPQPAQPQPQPQQVPPNGAGDANTVPQPQPAEVVTQSPGPIETVDEPDF
jgi:hypothetical protein